MMPDSPDGARIRFGAFCFDLKTLELSRRGDLLRLQRQPAQLLACLLQRPGRLVSRPELAQHLWGGTVVETDQGLNNAVRHLRKVLGDNADAPVFIETVPRLGYRFIAPLAGPKDSPPPPSKTPALFRAGIGALMLVAALAAAGWLILLLLPEDAPARVRLADANGPPDPQARDAFLQARQEMAKGDLASLRSSVSNFERAARLAPDYAPAQLGWAWTAWLSEAESRELRQTALQRAEQSLKLAPDSPEAHLLRAEIAFYHEWDAGLAQRHYRQALQIGAGLKEVHAAYALFSALTGQSEAARRHAEMALDLDPASAMANLLAGMSYLRSGVPERAAELCRQARSIDSGSGADDCIVAAELALNDLEGAVRALAEWIPSTDPSPQVLQRIESSPDSEAALARYLRWRFHLLSVAVRQPFPAGAKRPEAEDQPPVWASPMGELWSSPGRVAAAAAQAGGEDAALQWLQRAHAQRSPSFLRWAGSPAMAGLRQRSQYQALLADSPLP